MNIIKLYQDYHIPYETQGHKHCRPGWVNTACPWCTGNPGLHLGYCIDPKSQFHGSYVCWRCGGKGVVRTVAKLLGSTDPQASLIIQKYGGLKGGGGYSENPKPQHHKKPGTIVRDIALPPGCQPLTSNPGACRYLMERRFDPTRLQEEWELMFSPQLAILQTDKWFVDYSWRIIIPIHYQGKIVSFQGRDYTGKREPKYLTAPKSLESVHHKDILYGLDKAPQEQDWIVLVEGVTDVWRLGAGMAVACFGIKYRLPQVLLLAKRFKTVTLLFDPEPQATLQARKIARELKSRGVVTKQLHCPAGKDPADLTEDEAKELRKEIG